MAPESERAKTAFLRFALYAILIVAELAYFEKQFVDIHLHSISDSLDRISVEIRVIDRMTEQMDADAAAENSRSTRETR